jgi:3-hydroxyisobutyrate dehydrogenase-like beta-hydroxyacid dehydrogenase
VKLALLHPGAMGAALGASLIAAGHAVRWCAAGRSGDSRRRAEALGFLEAPSLGAALAGVDAVLSLVPPHGALPLAQAVAAEGYAGPYFDLNGISPATAAAVAACFPPGAYGDGAVVGLPPGEGDAATLLLSAAAAARLATFGPRFTLQVVPEAAGPFGASALKNAFAAWSKGSSALLLSVEALAEALGLKAELHALWDRHSPGLRDRATATGHAVAPKAWRFVGEMEEIASTFRAAGLSPGAFEAAAEVYGKLAGAAPAPPKAQDP